MQLGVGEISQMAGLASMWEMSQMAKKQAPPGISARLDELLMRAQPEDLSERQWCLQAQVSTSFFTDLRKGVEPGIDRVERLARRAGLKLSELVEGAERSVARVPTEDELAEMLAEAQDEAPAGTTLGGYPRAVAAGLRGRLLRHLGAPSNDSESASEPSMRPAEVARSRPPTKKSARAR